MKKVVIITLMGLFCFTITAHAVTMNFSDFSDTSILTLNGDAQTTATMDGVVLRLTPAQTFKSGSIFSIETVNASSFSTYFKFRITEAGGIGNGADGIVFVIQSIASDIVVESRLFGIDSSIGVEFDTYLNELFGDPSSNHLGIDLNGSLTHNTNSVTQTITPNFDDGNIWYAWIDYNGNFLEVRVSQDGIRPSQADIQQEIDIPALLGQEDGYVGFKSGTGDGYGDHDILYWEYRDSYNPIITNPDNEMILDFETTPGGEIPTDNSTLSTPYSFEDLSVRLFFDTNENNVYDEGIDLLPVFEQVGDSDSDHGFLLASGYDIASISGYDIAFEGFESQLGSYFLRHPTTNTGTFPAPLILDYDTSVPISELSGEIWDIDGDNISISEQWLVEVLDQNGNVISSKTSPLGSSYDTNSLNGKPWVFNFTELPSGVDKVKLSFIGGKVEYIGLAFNNFRPTTSALSCITQNELNEIIQNAYDQGYIDGQATCEDGVECAQVITYAQVPKADCWVEFSTPCDVPEGWKIVFEEPSNMCGSVDDTSSENTNNCSTFNIFSNTLHVPCFNGGSTMYWLDLELTGSEPVTLELKDLGSR